MVSKKIDAKLKILLGENYRKGNLRAQILNTCYSKAKNGIYYSSLENLCKNIYLQKKLSKEELAKIARKESFLQTIRTLMSDIEEKRTDTTKWPILRLLHPGIVDDVNVRWILFITKDCPWITDLSVICSNVEKYGLRVETPKIRKKEKVTYPHKFQVHQLELYILEYLWNQETIVEKLESILVKRTNIIAKSTNVFSSNKDAAWINIEISKRKNMPSPLTDLTPSEVLEKLKTRSLAYQGELKQKLESPEGGVPSLPNIFVPREDLLQDLKEAVLSEDSEQVMIAGVQGMGGVGKTILATDLANNPEVIKRFKDRIIWVIVGQEASPMNIQREIAHRLGLTNFYAKTIGDGSALIERELNKQDCLIILDDIWKQSQLEVIQTNKKHSKLLYTTRNKDISLDSTKKISVDTFSRLQSLSYFAQAMDLPISQLPKEADDIVEECGNLPLAVAMVASMLEPGDHSCKDVLEILQSSEIDKIRANIPRYPHPNILKVIEASLNTIKKKKKRRFYKSLAVFDEDILIPKETLVTYASVFGFSRTGTVEMLDLFVRRSLLFKDNEGRYYLHDLQHDYIKQSNRNMKELHQKLINAYSLKHNNLKPYELPDDGYYYSHFIKHLYYAEKQTIVGNLLLDYSWIRKKLDVCDANALVLDYQYSTSQDATSVGQSLRLSEYVLSQSTNELSSQLIGRLDGLKYRRIKKLINNVKNNIPINAFKPLLPSLDQSGERLKQIISTYDKTITSIATIPERNEFVTADNDNLIKYCMITGRKIKSFESKALEVIVSPNGRYLATASGAVAEIVLSDMETVMHHITIADSSISNIIFSPDSKFLVIIANNRQISKWSIDNGDKVSTLLRKCSNDTRIALNNFGNTLAITSNYKTIQIRDLESKSLLNKFNIKEGLIIEFKFIQNTDLLAIETVNNLTLFYEYKTGVLKFQIPAKIWFQLSTTNSDDLILGLSSGEILIWNIPTSKSKGTIGLHVGSYRGIINFKQGILVTAGKSGEIRFWDVSNLDKFKSNEPNEKINQYLSLDIKGKRIFVGSPNAPLRYINQDKPQNIVTSKENCGPLYKLQILDSKKHLLAVEKDHRVRIRELTKNSIHIYADISTFENEFLGVTVISNKIISSSTQYDLDGVSQVDLIIQDIFDRDYEKQLENCHSEKINDIAFIRKGKAVLTASSDKSVALIDIGNCKLLRRCIGHTNWVQSICVLQDEKLFASVSDDKTIRVWNIRSGKEVSKPGYHDKTPYYIKEIPTKKLIATGCRDGIIKLWTLPNLEPYATLNAHSQKIVSICPILNENYIVSASEDKTIRLWNIETKENLSCFHTDGVPTQCVGFPDLDFVVATDTRGALHVLRVVGNNLTSDTKI